MKRLIAMLLLLALTACMPTPQKVSEAIGRGQMGDAVDLLSTILNHDGQISSHRLELLLEALELSHHFDLDVADDLFDSLNHDGQRVILRWYMQVYLKASEQAIKEGTRADKQLSPAENIAKAEDGFEQARLIWRRHQKVRALSFPNFREAIPVQGIIDLREAEYLVQHKQKQAARQVFAQARKKLTDKKPFDLVQQYAFEKLVQEVQKALK